MGLGNYLATLFHLRQSSAYSRGSVYGDMTKRTLARFRNRHRVRRGSAQASGKRGLMERVHIMRMLAPVPKIGTDATPNHHTCSRRERNENRTDGRTWRTRVTENKLLRHAFGERLRTSPAPRRRRRRTA